MRGVLLLLVGLGTGLAAGWALFADGRPPDRANRTQLAPGTPEGASTARPGAERTGVGGAGAAAPTGGRPAPAASSEELIVRRLMREAYDERVKGGKAPEADLFEAGVREVLRRTAEYRDSYARNLGAGLEHRERLRTEVGDISESPLVLQICVPGSGRARLAERGSTSRFRVAGPPAQGATLTHVTGGMVPPGSMFLIDRVVLRAYFGPGGGLDLTLPDTDTFHWDSVERGRSTIETELKGLVHLRHGYEKTVSVDGHVVAASVEIHGRLVPEAEGEATPTRPLMMGEGWLTGEPVVMQVLADHGGGNDRTVYLDGKLYRIDSLEGESIWEDAPNLRERRGSLAHYRGCGRVPPGKAFRVTCVEYRARLEPQEKNDSRLVVRVGTRDEVKADASQGGSVAGTWTGEVMIYPGREGDVSVTCNYFGLAEITVHGELVDDPRR